MKSLKFTRTINSNIQNRINKSIIFNYLRINGPCYRAKISKNLCISAPAVSRAIDSLLNNGYVIMADTIKTTNGKQTAQFKINSEKGVVVGVDLIKDSIEIAISDLSGKILYTSHGFKFSEKIDVKNELIDEIEKVLEIFFTKGMHSIEQSRLLAIGIGIPAVIDINTGAVIDAPLYGNLRGLNLKFELENKFNVPIYVENIVRLSALGEKNFGEGRKYKDIVFVEVSNGIGAGIILDNHLVRGIYGSAGEIGFSIFDIDNIGFQVNIKGFLEKVASVESIKEQAIERIKRGEKTAIVQMIGNDFEKLDPYIVCKAAIDGDRVSNEIITNIVKYLSLSLIQLILILNPQIIVLGGDMCNLPGVKRLFIDPIIKNINESILFDPPTIKISSLGKSAGVIGACFFAIESLLTGEFPYTIEHEVIS